MHFRFKVRYLLGLVVDWYHLFIIIYLQKKQIRRWYPRTNDE
jgi:hypothetical protein